MCRRRSQHLYIRLFSAQRGSNLGVLDEIGRVGDPEHDGDSAGIIGDQDRFETSDPADAVVVDFAGDAAEPGDSGGTEPADGIISPKSTRPARFPCSLDMTVRFRRAFMMKFSAELPVTIE